MTTSTPEARRLARDKRLRAQFNISADEWDLILRHQGGLCALCREKNSKSGKNKGKPKPLNTDHDHKSGLTRGILCTGCNYRLKEYMTLEWLSDVARYMEFPPAVLALGEERIGRKGRVTTRRSTKKRRRRAV